MLPQDSIISFDIAAVIVMTISLASLLVRGLTRGAANRVYLTAMVLVTITAIFALVGDIYDGFLRSLLWPNAPTGPDYPLTARGLVMLVYYVLRSLTAPAYLVLIATVGDTTHRLNNNNFTRFFLWVPMAAVFLVICTNPMHHLIFSFENGTPQRGSLIGILYIEAIYYSILGIFWLVRWRTLYSRDEFVTLALLYPIVFAAVVIQYSLPSLHLEMFVTSIAMFLVSAFAIHPETRIEPSINAANLEAYREACHRAFITEKPLCLVYLELVNMERLHQLLDKDELQIVVSHVSQNLANRLGRSDVLYYLRNGLFCISPRNTNPDRALAIARQAQEEGRARAMARPDPLASTALRVCLVRTPEDVRSTEQLRTFVRRLGHFIPEPNVTTFHELSQRSDFALQMALSEIITRAVQERSFEVHYQPIYCLDDGRFHSAEALVRLNDPEYGFIPPSLFIPEAEQTGAIEEIGTILLEKICRFLSTVDYAATGLDYVEVNLSVDQCVRPEFARELIDLVHENGIEPSRMNLEITETSATYSQQAIEANIRALSAAGFTFSLDDYGTGYSSITRLVNLPFSLVKLDKSFVDEFDDPSMRIALANTVLMVKELGKEALVEGVETREQAEALETLGVDYIQGYYYSKPLTEEEFISFLADRNS